MSALSARSATPAAPGRPGRLVVPAALLLSALLPLIALLPFGESDAPAPTGDPQSIEAMVDGLAARLKARPADLQGWLMLARSSETLQRYAQASEAYAQAARLAPDDAQLLADQADALAMAQGGSAKGEPTRLVERALAIDPHNAKALTIAANAAVERGDRGAAVAYLERAQALQAARAASAASR